ncbi:ribosome production factor 2 homolog [Ischnura elegans]|uniref:ribosome production factor 2 homolog n=1 Tax=Ischnura elegans TaxID=197161 RepID=UPI001ED890B1|nr:ribosome production factor 2 homolog [Ischnura elegans]
MPVLQRVVKPTTRKGKKVLLGREPKVIEDPKHALFIRGRNTNELTMHFMKDILALKRLHATMLNHKNDFLPFENIVPVEHLLTKHNSSLFMFASHNKKRPNNVVLGRTFDSHLLDMIEVGVESYRELSDFPGEKIMVGTKPIIHFMGDFESSQDLVTLKSLLADMFCGERHVSGVSLAGIEHVLVFTSDVKAGKIYARSYRIKLKKSGQRTPRVELEEMGPSFNLVVRRTKIASSDLMKIACRTPQEAKSRPKKNISKNVLGTTMGRVHIKKQRIDKLQTRKLKGLRKTAEERKAERKALIQKRRKNAVG